MNELAEKIVSLLKDFLLRGDVSSKVNNALLRFDGRYRYLEQGKILDEKGADG